MQRLYQRESAGRPRRVRWALDGHDYLVDDRFTIADVVMGSVLDSARRLDLMPDSPVLHAYLARLDAREANQRAYAA